MSPLFYAVGEVRPGYILCFQYMFAFYVFQNGHLLNSYLVEFLKPFALWQTFVDKDRIEVLHITQTNQLVNRRVVAYITLLIQSGLTSKPLEFEGVRIRIV